MEAPCHHPPRDSCFPTRKRTTERSLGSTKIAPRPACILACVHPENCLNGTTSQARAIITSTALRKLDSLSSPPKLPCVAQRHRLVFASCVAVSRRHLPPAKASSTCPRPMTRATKGEAAEPSEPPGHRPPASVLGDSTLPAPHVPRVGKESSRPPCYASRPRPSYITRSTLQLPFRMAAVVARICLMSFLIIHDASTPESTANCRRREASSAKSPVSPRLGPRQPMLRPGSVVPLHYLRDLLVDLVHWLSIILSLRRISK